MKIATAYTPFGGGYAEAAASLERQCRQLVLDFHGEVLPQCDRVRATRLKPKFMLWAASTWNAPFWFVDADGHVKAQPPAMPPGTWLALHPQPHKDSFPVQSAVIYVTPDPRCVRFLCDWIKETTTARPGVTDHSPLVRTWERYRTAPGLHLVDCSPWQWTNGFKREGRA